MKPHKLIITIIICFIAGTIITISKSNLQVLAIQVASIDNLVIIWSVAVGGGNLYGYFSN
ncbi:DUF1538 family protein [Thomasclavelia sp.]|uniref:DUF1538 family protein n=1 Tax=Thomasclavelia sp. TaxID=3025757 RepID=UPI0025D9ADBD|nr:DUF1538 family protein [Thomasclavelia sp.]